MPYQLLTHHELERRLLHWTGSAYVPRYPFYDGPLTYQVFTDKHLITGTFEDLNRWFDDIEVAANDCDVPLEQVPDVAIYFLRGDIRDVMRQRREVYLRQTKRVFWDWKDFKEDLKRIVVEANALIGSMVIQTYNLFTAEAQKMIFSQSQGGSNIAVDAMENLRRAHPYIASSIKLGLIIGGTAVLLPALGMMAWNKFQATQSERPNSPH